MMRDHSTPLRKAYIEALTGNLTMNSVVLQVVDGRVKALPEQGMYVVFGDQVDSDKSNKSKWVFETSIDIAIVDKRKVSAGKKDSETIADQILQIIFPTDNTYGINIEDPFRITFIKYLSGTSQNVFVDTLNHPVQVKRMQFINRVIQ
jgi:hypothetical protein